MALLKKIKYILGTIYRGLIGIWHNTFDKAPEINSEVESFVIGKSVEGREIKCYKVISNKIISNKVIIVGGIHGNEVGTVKLASHIINWFYNIYGRDAIYGVSKNVVARRDAIPKFVQWTNEGVSTEGLVLFVIPVLNPDGYARALKNPDYWQRGRVGRFNAHGVDLDRNFPANNFQSYSVWPFGKDYKEVTKVYCGEKSASEPETRALIDLVSKEEIGKIISLHNVGGDVIVDERNPNIVKWAEVYHKLANFRIIQSPHLSGNMSEWTHENGIDYITIEGTTRWGSDWGRQKSAIEKIIALL